MQFTLLGEHTVPDVKKMNRKDEEPWKERHLEREQRREI
jgi:hypothetical protein